MTRDDADEARALAETLAEPTSAWNPSVEVFCRLDDARLVGAIEAALLPIAEAHVRQSAGEAPMRTSVQLVSLGPAHAPHGLLEIIFALQALIVVIAIANVTNVLFASTANRAREIGTRLALGASRTQIARQLLTEGTMLSIGAGVVGLILAQWLTPLMATFVTATPAFDWTPDRHVFVMVAVSALVAGILASVAPIRYVRLGDLISAIKTDRAGAPRGLRSGRLRSTTVGVQAASSIVLLVVAALFSRSAMRLLTTDLGFDPGRTLTAIVSFDGQPDRIRLERYLSDARDRLRQVPGVTAVGLASGAPFEMFWSSLPDGHYVHRTLTSPDFFTLRRSRIVRGRAYSGDEAASGAPVAVISQSLARRYWGDGDPLGSSLERVWGAEARTRISGLTARPSDVRVVGIAADTVSTIDNFDAMAVYMPLRPRDLRLARILIETSSPAASLDAAVRRALRELSTDPGLTIQTTVVSTYVDRYLDPPAALAAVTSLIGLIALGLAAIGLFGITAFAVAQRRHEVAVRMALGARGGQVVRMLLRDGLRPVIIGLAAGLVAAFIVANLLRRAFYGVSGHDPIAIVVAVAVLLAAACLAIVIPARRAATIDPAKMLRES